MKCIFGKVITFKEKKKKKLSKSTILVKSEIQVVIQSQLKFKRILKNFVELQNVSEKEHDIFLMYSHIICRSGRNIISKKKNIPN